MNVAILGIDGYLGWPLALHLIANGHSVVGVDDFSRRRRVKEIGCNSLTPILDHHERMFVLTVLSHPELDDTVGWQVPFGNIALGTDAPEYIESFLDSTKPDAIVHLAEQPSAPWSMRSVKNATRTQIENVVGTLHLLWAMHNVCPDAHLVKLGTMGEYGTPDCDIPEGEIPHNCIGNITVKMRPDVIEKVNTACPMAGLQFPRRPGSWYHLTKVHDSYNIEFPCRNWNLRSTDIMQGPVFGVETKDMNGDESLITRFDYDEQFGTIINRFCVQAIFGHPLTVYGKGGQTRGYLPISDSMECLTLALENPPKAGEYRTFNQFERTYSCNKLAEIVKVAGAANDLEVTINHYDNPRKEAETHYYNPHRNKLVELGYKPTTDITEKVAKLIHDLLPYKDKIKEHLIVPETRWDTDHHQSRVL